MLVRALRPGLWLPFLVVAAAQALALGLLLEFHRPWLQPLLLPLLRAVGGESALHYPYFYLVLPVAMAWIGLGIGVLLASFTSGAATGLFARAFGEEAPERPWAVARRRYPALLILTLLVTVIVTLVFRVQESLPRELLLESRVQRWGIRFGFLFLVILIQSLFVYATAWIVLRGRSLGRALADSVRTALSMPIATLLLVGLPTLLVYPFRFIAGRGDLFTAKFRPELMVGVLGTTFVVEVLLGFLLVGGTTFVFLWRHRGEGAP